jgi:hypothetical protein
VPKRKVVPFVSNYSYETFGEIWTSERTLIRTSKCGCLKILIIKKMSGPTCQSQAPLKQRLDADVTCVHAIASQPVLPPRVGTVDRPPRPLQARRMQPPPCASSPCAIGPKEKPVLSSSCNGRRALATPLCLLPRLYSFIIAPLSPLCHRTSRPTSYCLMSPASPPSRCSQPRGKSTTGVPT